MRLSPTKELALVSAGIVDLHRDLQPRGTDLLRHASRFLVGKLRRGLRPIHEIEIETPDELAEQSFWIEKKPVRMHVRVDLLRMQGAFDFGAGHPFRQALAKGPDALTEFYDKTQPRTIAEYYGLSATMVGADIPPWELPWYGREARRAPPGELELGPEHGVSFYGPCTSEKVALELRRLEELKDSIGSYGYDPDAYGDIEGYVLRDRSQCSFFVRGGKHRAAVLAHLGHEFIPVAFRQRFPRLIDAAQAEVWPLVRSGKMSAEFAQEILHAYTGQETRDRKQ